MATRKKRVVIDRDYSKLDEHCIWLNEYYTALRRAGFSVDNCLWLLAAPESYPEWINPLSTEDIRRHIEDEED
jgi:hypothetical protein